MHCRPFSTKSKTFSKAVEDVNISSVISPYKGFENSFQQTNVTPSLPVDTSPGKKWSSFSEGFNDADSWKTGSDRKSNSSVRNSRSAKRKISELAIPEDEQLQPTGNEDLDQLSTEINWQSSSDSETDTVCPSPRENTLSSKRGNNSFKKIKSTKTSISSTLKRQFSKESESPNITEFDGHTINLPKPVFTDDDKIQSKGDDGSIVSYESDDEEFKEIKSQAKESGSERAELEDISEPSSSTSPLKQQTDDSNRIKAGDWLKSVQWQAVTPTKVSPSKDPDINLGDSAKKKRKKYARNSLAEQLSRLQSREKSAMSVWYHKTKENLQSALTKSQESSKSLTVKVTSLETICSLRVATCQSLSIDNDCVTPDTPKFNVILPFSSTLLPKISVGLIVQLLPPWQTLSVPGIGKEILLCCYYTVVNCFANNQRPNLPEENTTKTCKAVWKCPCIQADYIDPLTCPAQRMPCNGNIHVISQATNQQADCISSQADSSTTLHTVLASQRSDFASSILYSIEKVGHSTSHGLSFQAKIQRVFCQRNDNCTFSRWSILVEDSHGVFAHVTLPDHSDHLDNWKEVLLGEGLSVRLTGVILHNRTNRDRDPSLFSVLDAVWQTSVEKNPELEFSTEDSASQNETMSRPSPGFCYMLKAWHGRSGVHVLPDTATITTSQSTAKQSQHLKDILQTEKANSKEDKRVNLLCKVIFIDKRQNSVQTAAATFPQCDKCCHVLYITDQSLCTNQENSSLNNSVPFHNPANSAQKSSSLLQKCDKSALILPFYVLKSGDLSEIPIQANDLVYVRDANLHDGKLIADEYSRSILVSSHCVKSCFPFIHNDDGAVCASLNETNFIAESLSEVTSVDCLVTVSGVICGVNEAECYSWPECDTCGCDRLTSLYNNSLLRCPVCKRVVQSPENRIKMEVYVKCKDLPEKTQVILQLLEKTIHLLLPDNEEDEEYDISSVLGSFIGPLSCILQEKQTNQEPCYISLKLQEVEIT